MIAALDNFIDRITMYRLVLYYLIALLLAAAGLSLFGDLHYGVRYIAASSLILVLACWATNKVFSIIFNAPTNFESVYITALILALIIAPMSSFSTDNITFLLAVSGLAMASKYILTIGEKHIFNPAAIAIALTAIGPRQSANWWVGTTVMLPFVVIGGILVVRKLRRWPMVLSFFAAALIATVIYNLVGGNDVISQLQHTLSTSALLFLGFIMLTEPMTAPPTIKKQISYAVLIGIMFPPEFHIATQYSTPELALVVGNIYSYIISPKIKLFPTLVRIDKLTPDTFDFIFNPGKKFKYKPGQYMEWTLPHTHMDSRGERRVFTLASSPTEQFIHLGVKFYNPSSSYKKTLLKIMPESSIVAGQLAGDFTLPRDQKQKLVFIAGGIGVTPFRSMVKYMLDMKQFRPVTMLYGARSSADIAYRDIFEQARSQLGIKVIYNVSQPGGPQLPSFTRNGLITADVIEAEVPDYLERQFYLSGTHQMVLTMQNTLTSMGVKRTHIKTDFFPGYV